MNGWMELLAAALVRTTLATTVAAVVAIALLALLRVRSARVHRFVWLLVIAQGWCLAGFSWRIEVSSAVVEPLSPLAAVAPLNVSATEVLAIPTNEPTRAVDVAAVALKWCLGVWIAVIVGVIAIGAMRYVRLFTSGRPGELPQQPEWIDEWELARRKSQVRRAELRLTRDLGPLVCWVPRVVLVLVPRTLWLSLTRDDRLAILRHELAHCERGDLWKNLAVRVLALPQWFNPLVWFAVRRFEEAGEWACDEHVARVAPHSAIDYASTLLRVADFVTHVPAGSVGLTGGTLSRRVKRLLHLPDKEVREMRSMLLIALLFCIALFQVIRIERVAADEPAAEAATSPAAKSETDSPQEKRAFAQPYVIEPPDVLQIDAGKLTPKESHEAEPQPIAGEHLVGPDGSVNLGKYGTVSVSGMTIRQAKQAIDAQLAKFFVDPDVAVDVFASNSKKYYVVETSPMGDNVTAFPITGNEYVMDAIAVIGGLRGAKDQAKIWIDRPTGNDGKSLIKPVDYQAITVGHDASTNYQLWPGDRLFLEMADNQETEVPPQVHPSPPTAPYDPTSAYQEPDSEGDPRAIKFEVRLITDPKRNLRNIEGLADGHHVVGDSQLLEGLLGVLTNNGLSQTLASPTIVTKIGRKAQLTLAEDETTGAGDVDLVLITRQRDKHVVLEVLAKVTRGRKFMSVDTAVEVSKAQSYILRLPAEKNDPQGEDLYLIITQE